MQWVELVKGCRVFDESLVCAIEIENALLFVPKDAHFLRQDAVVVFENLANKFVIKLRDVLRFVEDNQRVHECSRWKFILVHNFCDFRVCETLIVVIFHTKGMVTVNFDIGRSKCVCFYSCFQFQF